MTLTCYKKKNKWETRWNYLMLLILTSHVFPQGSLLSGEEGTVWISKSKTKPHQDEDSWFWSKFHCKGQQLLKKYILFIYKIYKLFTNYSL